MTVPWMRRKTHTRLQIEQGEAYRREIEEARSEAARARADLRRFVDSLTPKISTDKAFPEQNVRILIEIERHLLVREPMPDLLLLIRDRIMDRLLNLSRDYRGDMRETPGQRALRL